MNAKEAWRMIHRLRRAGNKLRIARSYFLVEFNHARKQLHLHGSDSDKPADIYLIRMWAEDIARHAMHLERIDEAIMAHEIRISRLQVMLRS
ncbi:MAG: hypothetical protein WC641_04830 [Patescibacteria group bacterium]